MIFKNDEELDKVKEEHTPPMADEMNDADGDGKESVKEYVDRKKVERESEEQNKKAEDENKKNMSEEDAKRLKEGLSTAANVISAVPHIATFGAGAVTAGLVKKFLFGK